MVSELRSTLIIWSDAVYEASRGALGFVAFDPDDDQYYYSAYVVPSWVYLFFRAHNVGNHTVSAGVCRLPI